MLVLRRKGNKPLEPRKVLLTHFFMLRIQQQSTLLFRKNDEDKNYAHYLGLGFRLSLEMYVLHYNTFVLYVFSHFLTVITESNLKDTRLNRKRPPTLVSSDAERISCLANLHGTLIP